jgi:Domain of unknown function (DUF362)
MNRRSFLGFSLAAVGAATAKPQQRPEMEVASATRDQTPRVGLVPSTFAGGQTHDGTPLPGLPSPVAIDAELSSEQLDAMVRRAIEFGARRQEGLGTIGPDEWVVIKPDISSCFGLDPITSDAGASVKYVPGSVTDLRLVRSLIGYLVEHKHARRITIAEGSAGWKPVEHSKASVDGWTTTWGGAFDGLSYKSLIENLSGRHPGIEFDLVDLNFDATIQVPVSGRPLAANNQAGMYHLPATIQECDRLISVSPLKIDPRTGVSLSLANYRGIAPGSQYGLPKTGLDQLGDADAIVADLFSLRPADYAIVGGSWGIEADRPEGTGIRSVRHNVIIAGPNAVGVDAVAAAVMGFDPSKIEHLRYAESLGLGGWDTDAIWIKGAEIGEARREFWKPSGWGQALAD